MRKMHWRERNRGSEERRGETGCGGEGTVQCRPFSNPTVSLGTADHGSTAAEPDCDVESAGSGGSGGAADGAAVGAADMIANVRSRQLVEACYLKCQALPMSLKVSFSRLFVLLSFNNKRGITERCHAKKAH